MHYLPIFFSKKKKFKPLSPRSFGDQPQYRVTGLRHHKRGARLAHLPAATRDATPDVLYGHHAIRETPIAVQQRCERCGHQSSHEFETVVTQFFSGTWEYIVLQQ